MRHGVRYVSIKATEACQIDVIIDIHSRCFSTNMQWSSIAFSTAFISVMIHYHATYSIKIQWPFVRYIWNQQNNHSSSSYRNRYICVCANKNYKYRLQITWSFQMYHYLLWLMLTVSAFGFNWHHNPGWNIVCSMALNSLNWVKEHLCTYRTKLTLIAWLIGSIIVSIHITPQQRIECEKYFLCFIQYAAGHKNLFHLFESNSKTEQAFNVYDYASMISPFISVSFVFKENYGYCKRIKQQHK